MTDISFELQAGPLRKGKLKTTHGEVTTPCIAPLLMQGTLGPVDAATLFTTGVRMVAADGLELMVAPGINVLKASNGLANFLGWPGVTLTFSGLHLTTEKLKKNASRLGFRYQEPITKADKRMDATSAAQLQRAMHSDLPIAAFQNISYYAPVDDLASAAKINSDLQHQEQALLPTTIPAINGGGIKAVRKQFISNWQSLKAAFLTQLSQTDFAEWKRIVQENFALLPHACLRIIVADNAAELLAALRLGADIIVTGLPLVDAVQGLAYSHEGPIRIKEAIYQSDMHQLAGHSVAYWHYLHHEGANAATRGLTINNLQCLLQAVDRDVQSSDVEYLQAKLCLTGQNGGNK